jgi:hypothetical protein
VECVRAERVLEVVTVVVMWQPVLVYGGGPVNAASLAAVVVEIERSKLQV